MSNNMVQKIQQALTDLQQGKMIILVDDEARENEGDLVMAAEFVTPDAINFMIQQAGGFICLSMPQVSFEKLGIPMMVKENNSQQKTPFGVPIEAATGVTTGVSSADRAHTIQVACHSQSGPDDIVMPGHVPTLCANPGGVLARAGHTEGSVDLMKLAGLKSAAVICEIMNTDGTMARRDDLLQYAKRFNLQMISIHDLITYRIQHEKLIQEISKASLPLQKHGEFTIHTFRDAIQQCEHIALVREPISSTGQPCLVRMHSECLTGDVFASVRCDCGNQLAIALDQIVEHGGVLLYLRQEGRGIGLANKIKAYALQDQGYDTVEANHHLGFPADQRDYGIAAQILSALDVQRINLLTNNPHKIENLKRYGVNVVERVALETKPTPDNIHYLRTKREKLGHLLSTEL